MRWVALTVGVLLLVVLAWAYLYSDLHDPKNMRYVLWKHDLVSMDLDLAAGNIEEDPAGKRDLILGKTPQQLRERFGFLLTPKQARAEQCVNDSWAKGSNAMFIRNTIEVVTFKNGVAVRTGLLKPC